MRQLQHRCLAFSGHATSCAAGIGSRAAGAWTIPSAWPSGVFLGSTGLLATFALASPSSGFDRFIALACHQPFSILHHWRTSSLPDNLEGANTTGELEYRQRCYRMVFQERSGPKRMGRLLIAPHGPAVTADDASSFLHDLDDLSIKQLQMGGDFVCIFDISRLSWPAMYAIPSILRVVATHKLSEPFKQRTQAFAIVSLQRGWFDKVIEAIISIKRAESPPIFATSLEDADTKLNDRF